MSIPELRRALARAFRSDLKEARRLLARLERVVEREGTPVERADALLQRAQLDHLEGRHDDAAHGYARARARFLRQREPARAQACDVSAVQLHALRGDAAAVRRTVRRLRRAEAEPLRAAYTEIAIGSALQALGDERGAEACYRRALEGLARAPDGERARLARATARLNLGIRLARRGAVGEALDELDGAHAWFRDAGMEANAEIALHNLGWTHGLGGELERGARELASAREAFAARGDRRREALVRLDEAELALRCADHESAAREARAAARVLERAGVPLDAARARLVASRAFLLGGRRARGRTEATRARESFVRGRDPAGSAMADALLGERLARAERVLRGHGHLLPALEALVGRAAEQGGGRGAGLLRDALRAYPAPLARWARPAIERLRAAPGGADRIAALRRCVRATEELRRRAPTGRLRATTLAAHAEGYGALVAALLERGRPRDRREAFAVLDRARARTLLEEVRREVPGLADTARVRALRAELEGHWAALARADATTGDARALLARVGRLERALLRALEEQAPAAGGAAARDEPPAGACLTWTVHAGRVHALLHRDGEVESWPAGALAPLRRELESFRLQAVKQLFAAAGPARAEACLAALGERLLRADPLEGLAALTVVLPPELGELPVEALQLGGRAPLAGCALAYAPCAAPARAPAAPGGRPLVAGGDDRNLPELAAELAEVEAALPGAERLDPARADRATLTAALGRRPLVHLAGHVQPRPDRPLLSALRLADGWLAAADFAGVPLRGATVVLSTCRSGDPSHTWRGETLAGFPRVLLAAGAAAVVAGRWEVRDAVARAWMRALYPRISALPAERAVAEARLIVRQDHPHPADWGCFVPIRAGSM